MSPPTSTATSAASVARDQHFGAAVTRQIRCRALRRAARDLVSASRAKRPVGKPVPGRQRTRAFSGRGRHILTTVTIQIRRDDRERAEGRRQSCPRPKAAVLLGDKDGHVVGIRRDQVRKAVTRHIGQTHAPVRIAADVDRCCPRECAIPAAPEQPDGLGRPVVDQEVRGAIGVDVLQSNGVRVWRDSDAESRVVPVFEASSGDPEEQRDVVRLVVCDREVGKPVLVDVRDGQVHGILAGGTGPRHIEVAVTLTSQHENALAAGNHEVKPAVAVQIASPSAAFWRLSGQYTTIPLTTKSLCILL